MRIAFSIAAAGCLCLAGCMSQQPPLGMPDAGVIPFDGVHAGAPDCKKLLQPSHLRDPDGHLGPSIAFGCATYTNLATQLARPADLTAPLPYPGAHAADAQLGGDAVNRYENGKAIPPSTSTTSSVTSGSTTSAPAQ